jgi:anti-sigma regulatory factor (Ser/Thr protein kinase)
MRLCDEAERLRVGIALEEGLLNAFYHGNLEVSSSLKEIDHEMYTSLAKQRCREEPYVDRRIYVHARFTRAEARYTIRDEGPGFDLASLPDPTDPANLEKPSGRGVLLMRTFLDEVHYNEKGNEVVLVKRAEVQPESLLDEEE